jgi:cell division septal protein FtsQ
MARKRKRRLKGGVIWFLVLINVALGLCFSPITGASHVRVIGARPSDESRITEELQWLKNKPCVVVLKQTVEQQIYRNPLVKNVDLSQNIFGRAELKTEYYRPVALLKNAKNCVLTENGVLCPEPDPPAGLPLLEVYPEGTGPDFAISMTWEPANLAAVCDRALKQGIIKNLSIVITRNGSVCLNSGVTGRVVLGAPDELDEKFDQIRTILTAQPNLMTQGKELVLVAPKRPVTRPMQANL